MPFGFPKRPRPRPGESTHGNYIWSCKGPQTEQEIDNVKIPESSFKDKMLLSREIPWIKNKEVFDKVCSCSTTKERNLREDCQEVGRPLMRLLWKFDI